MLYALLVHFYQAIPPVFLWRVGERGRRIEKGERTNRGQERGQKAGKRKESEKSSPEECWTDWRVELVKDGWVRAEHLTSSYMVTK